MDFDKPNDLERGPSNRFEVTGIEIQNLDLSHRVYSEVVIRDYHVGELLCEGTVITGNLEIHGSTIDRGNTTWKTINIPAQKTMQTRKN